LRVRRRRSTKSHFAPWWLLVPAIFFMIAIEFYAPIDGARYAFTNWNGVSPARYIGLANFREIFSSTQTRGALEHTLELAAGVLVIANALGLVLALGLNRSVKSRYLLRSVFFLPLVMSPLAISYVWQYIFAYGGALNALLHDVGLDSWRHAWVTDTHWALWTILVVLVWQHTGLCMVIFLAGLQGIPEELVEASAVDGATTWTRFRRIVFPLLAPAFTINATLTLVYGLRAFDQVFALTGGGPGYATETLATQVYRQTFEFGRFGFGAALALILALLITLLAVLQLSLLRIREARI
jgi:raffinose/stachyose/melibiose transport system permease protein